MKKNLARKTLVLDRQTLRVLTTEQLTHASGGQPDPTRGICGTSKGTYCTTNFFTCTVPD
jgi:hypothetical protein